jgi:hypothetical protein
MSDEFLIVAVVILVILCTGDPDLLDAIIKRVGSCP